MHRNHRPAPAGRARCRGISLIEVCCTLAVAATLATIGTPDLGRLVEGRRVDGAATRLAADLQLSRTEAVARNLPVRMAFDATVEAGCYLVHTGPAGDCRCQADGSAACTGDAQAIRTVVFPVAERVALFSNVSAITFDPLHGTATPTATLRVVGAQGRTVHHVVNVMGRTRSCSPLGTVPGYRSC
jgi:type IV fimbrial biogenesis protein FimT